MACTSIIHTRVYSSTVIELTPRLYYCAKCGSGFLTAIMFFGKKINIHVTLPVTFYNHNNNIYNNNNTMI